MRHFKDIKKTTSNSAFTAVEAVVYIGVFTLILGAISALLVTVYRSHGYSIALQSSNSEVRLVLEKSVNDIREASYADNGAYPVYSMSPNEFVFFSDVDNDGKIEKVRYFLQNHHLKRGVIKSSGTPATYNSADETVKTLAWTIRNSDYLVPVFKYLDSNANEMSDLSKLLDLRTVQIRLLVDKDPSRPPDYFDFTTSATLRNIANAYDKW